MDEGVADLRWLRLQHHHHHLPPRCNPQFDWKTARILHHHLAALLPYLAVAAVIVAVVAVVAVATLVVVFVETHLPVFHHHLDWRVHCKYFVVEVVDQNLLGVYLVQVLCFVGAIGCLGCRRIRQLTRCC